MPVRDNIVPLSDGAGEVVEVGAGVARVKVGDRVAGCFSVGSMQMFEAMNRTITANGIKPVIDKVFGFDEVHAAYKHMASSAHFGKIVIHVA
jgi:NADPH:quinone reductase-like Zn-dependent oxidoreductase